MNQKNGSHALENLRCFCHPEKKNWVEATLKKSQVAPYKNLSTYFLQGTLQITSQGADETGD